MAAPIPSATIAILDSSGKLTLPWRLFFQGLSSGSGSSTDISALEAEVAALASQVAIVTATANDAATAATGAQETADLAGGLVSGVLDLTPSSGGGGALAVKQAGTTIVTAATSLNFTAGATITAGGTEAEINITGGGSTYFITNAGPPTTLEPEGTVISDTTNANLYISRPVTTVGAPTVVQVATANAGVATLLSTPIVGHLILAILSGPGTGPGSASPASGWSVSPSGYQSISYGWSIVYYQYATSGTGTTIEPDSRGSSAGGALAVWEVSGVSSTFSAALDVQEFVAAYNSVGPYMGAGTSSAINDLYLTSSAASGPGGGPYTSISTTGLSGFTTDKNVTYSYMGHGTILASGVTPTFSATGTGGAIYTSTAVFLKGSSVTYPAVEFLGPIVSLNGGTALDSQIKSINFSTGLTASTDGAGNLTVTASGGANSTGELFSPPAAAYFPNTYDGSGAPALTVTYNAAYGLNIAASTTVAGDYSRAKTKTVVNSTWTIVARLRLNAPSNAYLSGGVVLLNTATNRLINFELISQGPSSPYQIQVNRENYPSGYVSTVSNFDAIPYAEWFKVTWDGTNYNFYVSREGEFWINVCTELGSAFLGSANQIGICLLQSVSTSFSHMVTCPYWSDNA